LYGIFETKPKARTQGSAPRVVETGILENKTKLKKTKYENLEQQVAVVGRRPMWMRHGTMPRNGVRYMTENPLEGPKESRKGANERDGREKRFGTKRGSGVSASPAGTLVENELHPPLSVPLSSSSPANRVNAIAIVIAPRRPRCDLPRREVFSDRSSSCRDLQRFGYVNPRDPHRKLYFARRQSRRIRGDASSAPIQTTAPRNRVIGMTYFARAYSALVASCSLV